VYYTIQSILMKMKKGIMMVALVLLVAACNKDDNGNGYVQVKPIEHQIYLNIKEYRETNGHSGSFVEQYLIVAEAQKYSYRMASRMVPLGTDGLDEHWATLENKYTFYNRTGLVLKTASEDEAEILTEILQIQGADSALLGDITQCGVGVATDTAGFNFVTVMLAKAD
jgi:hypothetical protein